MTANQRLYLDNAIKGIIVKGSYSEANLKQQAIEHYKNLWLGTPFMLESVRTPSREQVEQWMVNYVRHELTQYDEVLIGIAGNIPGGYFIFKSAVLDKIAAVYPFLKDECEKQKKDLYFRMR